MQQDDVSVIQNTALASKKELVEAYKSLVEKVKAMGAPATAEPALVKQVLAKTEQAGNWESQLRLARGEMEGLFSDLEHKSRMKLKEFGELEEVIQLEEAKLKDLRDLDRAAVEVKSLLVVTEELKQKFDQEKQELDARRKRDEEEYKFTTELARKKDLEEFESEKRKREQELQEKVTQLNAREQALQTKEGELNELRAQVQQFNTSLEAELAKQKQLLVAELQADKATALTLLQKDIEAQRAVFEGQVHNLQSSIDNQKTQIERLEGLLKESQKQVQEVVLKSIEASSQSKAFEAVNEYAKRQTPSQFRPEPPRHDQR